jgi:flagellar basal body rod protein FlgB
VDRRTAVKEINDAELSESVRRQMTRSVVRQVAAAGNLAGLDTPGYKSSESSVVSCQSSVVRRGSSERHF